MTKAGLIHPAIAGDAPWQRATCEYVDRLRAHYGDRLAAVVLYGSRARGDADQESDVDLMVVLAGEFDSTSEQQVVWNLREGIEEKHGWPLLSAILETEDDYRRRMLPLFINVRREGIDLWPIGRKRVRDEPADYQASLGEDIELVMKRARETLREAQYVVGQKFYRGAANRAYYAMFHAATALLLSEGLAFSKHQGVIGGFNRLYVKTGRFPKSLGSRLDHAFDVRNVADYSHSKDISPELAEQLIQNAAAFVQEAERLLTAESSQ
jgi:uncharacterized protein (UPF0332 family)/predicted nucleotidyltransferase